jgi:hypothetical protein
MEQPGVLSVLAGKLLSKVDKSSSVLGGTMSSAPSVRRAHPKNAHSHKRPPLSPLVTPSTIWAYQNILARISASMNSPWPLLTVMAEAMLHRLCTWLRVASYMTLPRELA